MAPSTQRHARPIPVPALCDRVQMVDLDALGRAAERAGLARLPQDPAPPRLLRPARPPAGALASAAAAAVAGKAGAVEAGPQRGDRVPRGETVGK